MRIQPKQLLKRLSAVLLPLLLIWAAALSSTQAQDQDKDKYKEYDVVVEVNGMFCPFCSYSVEKNLGKMEQVKQADVSITDNAAKLILKEDRKITQEEITKVITDAGYETGEFLKFPINMKTDIDVDTKADSTTDSGSSK